FAPGPRDLAARANLRLLVNDDLREDLLPELGDWGLDDRHADQARVHHLDEVLVLENGRDLLDRHGRALLPSETLVELNEALVGPRDLPDADLFAGEHFRAAH